MKSTRAFRQAVRGTTVASPDPWHSLLGQKNSLLPAQGISTQAPGILQILATSELLWSSDFAIFPANFPAGREFTIEIGSPSTGSRTKQS